MNKSIESLLESFKDEMQVKELMIKTQTPHMGMGKLGQNVKKFRWALEINDKEGNHVLEPTFVKLAARPNIKIEVERHYLGDKVWIPGKARWETITATIFDIEQQYIYNALNDLMPQDKYVPPKTDAVLRLYDGTGTVMETWNLEDTFLQAANFGELDHSSENITIEMTLQYSNIRYDNNLGRIF